MQDVADMKKQLPLGPDGSKIELRVRRVAVEVMTEKGPMFEPERAFGEDVERASR